MVALKKFPLRCISTCSHRVKFGYRAFLNVPTVTLSLVHNENVSKFNHSHSVKLLHSNSTPIFYVNAAPHIGHLYTALLADASCRWKELSGQEVKLVTGTDEHGIKIQRAADLNNQSPLEFCNSVTTKYQELFAAFEIRYTDYIRTTDDNHKTAVTHFWNKISEHTFKGYYRGWYCANDETFLSDSQVVKAKDDSGNISVTSAESGQPCEVIEEENYLFPLHKFKDELYRWHSGSVVYPTSFMSLVDPYLDSLGDLSISRPSSRVGWGIPVPNDSSQTIYVWVDALVNYLTAFGYPDSLQDWPIDSHIVGKDILKFHAIYWPAFLLAADLPLPKSIICHSHWLVDNAKMSKSVGNVVDPMSLRDRYTADGLRYFLLREGVLGKDGNFSEGKMVDYLNSELCNTLANLLSRCTSKSINSSQLYPPFNAEVFESAATEEWRELMDSLNSLPEKVAEHYNNFKFYKGVDCILMQLRCTNGFFDTVKPWTLKDSEDILHLVLHLVMENLRVCSILLQPIIPTLSANLLDTLGVPLHSRTVEYLLPVSSGSKTRHIQASGHLFKRVERVGGAK